MPELSVCLVCASLHVSVFNLSLCVPVFVTLSLYGVPEVHPLPRAMNKMEHCCFKQAHDVPVQQKLVRRKNPSGAEKMDLI